jgi:hypothetical protein
MKCTDCKKFIQTPGCEKNCKAWQKAKELYPVDPKFAANLTAPMTKNEKLRVAYIDNVASKCEECVPV